MSTSSLGQLRLALCALPLVTTLGLVPACSSSTPPPTAVEPAPSVQYEALRDDMRRLWSEHVIWTRVVIISSVAGLADRDAAVGRLLQNQVDIGDAFKPYYGEAAGTQLTALLHEHITIAADLIYAAQAGDAQAASDANTRWIANADAIAAFLASLNGAWALNDLMAMMRAHLQQTAAEATARISADYAADVLAYDVVVEHILDMADALTNGIAAQFPEVGAPQLGASDATLHLVSRKLWTDHVAWTRFFLMTAIAGLPDLREVTDRLLRNQADIAETFRAYYGDAASAGLKALMRDHILLAGALVGAVKNGDTRQVEVVQRLWLENADAIADFLYVLNPNHWSQAELRQMLHTHLAQTTDEALARFAADWARDIAAFDAIEAHILGFADLLSSGITAQFSTLSLH